MNSKINIDFIDSDVTCTTVQQQQWYPICSNVRFTDESLSFSLNLTWVR